MSAPKASSFPWWVGTNLGRINKCFELAFRAAPTGFGVGEESRMNEGLQKLPGEQGPRKLPRTALGSCRLPSGPASRTLWFPYPSADQSPFPLDQPSQTWSFDKELS